MKNMKSFQVGALGESAVYHDLVKRGYFIYFTMAEGAPFDFVSYKENEGFKVIEVKTTQRRNKQNTGWIVKIKRSKLNREEDFDNTEIDVLAVYLAKLDKILYLDAKKVTQKTQIVVSDFYVASYDREGKSVRRLTPS